MRIEQPYDNTLWLSFSWCVSMNHFIPVCVKTRNRTLQDCSKLVMSVLCDVDLLLLPSTWETLAMLGVCETFVLIDLSADKSPARKVSLFSWDRCDPHMSSIGGLTFLHLSNHTEMLCNALVSVPQLSVVMLLLVTDISNCVHRSLQSLN